MEGGRDCWNNPRTLSIATSMFACVSLSLLCLAVATDNWLYAYDRVEPEPKDNFTGYFIETYSGLWKKCTLDILHNPDQNCSYIPYFKHVEKDNLRPSETVLLSLRKSAIFPVVSVMILIMGDIICFMGVCGHKNSLTFVSGIMFVVGGLINLIGVIIFISAVTEESTSSKPKSSMDEPKFKYSYGPSFVMTISSFIGCQVTGVLSVYLCIVQFRHSIYKRHHLSVIIQQGLSTKAPCTQPASFRSRYSTRDSSDDMVDNETMASTCHDLIDPLNVPTPFFHPPSPTSPDHPQPSTFSQLSVTSPLNVLTFTTPPYYYQEASNHPYNSFYDPNSFNFYRNQVDNLQRRLSRSCLGLSRLKTDLTTATTATRSNNHEDFDSDDASVRGKRPKKSSKLDAIKLNVSAQIHAFNNQQSSLSLQQSQLIQPLQPPKKHKSHRHRQHHKKQQRNEIRHLQQSQPLLQSHQPHLLLNAPQQPQTTFPQEYIFQPQQQQPLSILTHQPIQPQQQQLQQQQQRPLLQQLSDPLGQLGYSKNNQNESMGRTTIV